jgi:hypothetical protein
LHRSAPAKVGASIFATKINLLTVARLVIEIVQTAGEWTANMITVRPITVLSINVQKTAYSGLEIGYPQGLRPMNHGCQQVVTAAICKLSSGYRNAVVRL